MIDPDKGQITIEQAHPKVTDIDAASPAHAGAYAVMPAARLVGKNLGSDKWKGNWIIMWPFKKKKESINVEKLFLQAEARLRTQFEEELAAGTGRQAILASIEAESKALETQEQTAHVRATLRAYDLLYSEIKPRMMGNLSAGKAHEMAGRIEEAIVSYESAIVDQVPTRFPYEHLRVIYRRRQQYEAALRMCKTAVSNPFLSEKDHAHFAVWTDKLSAQLNQN
ncbi:MAG: hypothetical protein KC421_29035 [Anaerolineales bacterium]|nr:hypothetical protein [Anaerolineales bacterium]